MLACANSDPSGIKRDWFYSYRSDVTVCTSTGRKDDITFHVNVMCLTGKIF